MGENEVKNVHKNHRQRVKTRFLKENGFDSFSEHNILEMLLFYAIPQKDTNELAHRLIDRFGSIKDVFDADYDELQTVKGVTPNMAVLIKMVPSISKTYFDSVNKSVEFFDSIDDINNYLIPKFIGEKKEVLYIIALDNRGRVLKCSKISEGGIDYADINFRDMMTLLISCSATNVILSHNHPFGFCAPSSADHEITRKISNILNTVNITLVDHIIVSGSETFSFRNHSKFNDCFIGPNYYKFADNKIIWEY